MSSPARAAANAANAQLSTGPRTEAGKARSSRNAIQHGLSSRQNFIAPGEEREFAILHAGLFAQINPVGCLELHEFEVLVHAAWALRRCRLVEAHWMGQGPDALLEERVLKALAGLDRYTASHHRMYNSALKNLRMLQTARLTAGVIQDRVPTEEVVPALVSPGQIAKEVWQFTKRSQSSTLTALFMQPDARPRHELQNEPIAAGALYRQEAA
jgi:hypothetical protein